MQIAYANTASFKLLVISCASSLPETPPLTNRTWLGTGGRSLSACSSHSTCSSKASTRTKPS
ncbi:hypothetical protein SK128_008760 [Halocaridina rubra]|uniref:Uncharacterized protein n=1 Tax=Halocaridina rubra TaxID=373956 RepID=A0AAN8XJ91_HALRR